MKKAIAAILLIAAIALPQSAIAQSASFNSPHKWIDPATSKVYVFIPNQAPGLAIEGLTSIETSIGAGDEAIQANDCGWSQTDNFSDLIDVKYYNSNALNWAARTKGATPTCILSAGTYISSNNAPANTVIIAGKIVWIKGRGIITKTYGKKITTKTNACGFLKVVTSESRTMRRFSVAGANYTFATLPTVSMPVICRKVGTNFINYVPTN